jgi:hypothetical protein
MRQVQEPRRPTALEQTLNWFGFMLALLWLIAQALLGQGRQANPPRTRTAARRGNIAAGISALIIIAIVFVCMGLLAAWVAFTANWPTC